MKLVFFFPLLTSIAQRRLRRARFRQVTAPSRQSNQTGLTYFVNRAPLQSVSQLRAVIQQLKSGHPVVFQIERAGALQYLAFEMD